MLQINDLHKSYTIGKNNLHVLKGVTMNLESGEFVSIMGSSGSGKSTLLNIIGMLDNYDNGSYTLDGMLVKNLSEKVAAEYRNRYLGFVFQSFNLISYKTALENVALPLLYQNVNRKNRIQRAQALLDRVGLLDWAAHLPNELSGGQKQRVAIARALITNPKLILADEPTGALDSVTSHEVMELLTELNNEGKTILLVTHEQDIAALTHRTIVLNDGLVMQSHAKASDTEVLQALMKSST